MRRINISSLLALILLFTLQSCNKPHGIVIVLSESADSSTLRSILPPDNLKLGILDPSRPGKPARIISEQFLSACSPSISFDGRSMLFAGKKNIGSNWQIWEMNLSNFRTRQITSPDANSLFPAWLPASQIVYSRMIPGDSLRSTMALFKCNSDGTGNERITFNPATWYDSNVLADGRIIAKCAGELPEKSEAEIMVLRPDGTKAELFYEKTGNLSGGKVIESGNSLLFIEDVADHSALVSISYNNPFNSKRILYEKNGGNFIFTGQGSEGKILACYKSTPQEKYRLFQFDTERGQEKLLHESNSYDVLEAALITGQATPRKLPSEVDNLVKTGLLLCQDISVEADNQRAYPKPVKIEIYGIDKSMGVVHPEPDGSFYLKVIADTPFRIATMDEKGNIIKMCDWMSLRPNERRGCTGCHEDPEVVPENRIPMAVKKDPVIIPVTINRIEEKIIELE